jgi:hypothetical protein
MATLATQRWPNTFYKLLFLSVFAEMATFSEYARAVNGTDHKRGKEKPSWSGLIWAEILLGLPNKCALGIRMWGMSHSLSCFNEF